MTDVLRPFGWFLLAAISELAGCYAFWAWARLGRPAWWLGWGTLSLLIFALSLARVDVPLAGRAFAAYGGIYMVAALTWLVILESARPTRWDFAGVIVCLIGTAIILLQPSP